MSLLRGTGARLAAGATLALLALSGCSATPAAPPATVSASATPTPIFANDEEALAAAKKAYAAYEEMGDLILAEGGKNGERISSVVSASLAQDEMAGFEESVTRGLRSTGRSTFDNLTIQAIDDAAPNGVGVVTAYLCSDVSDVDVLDSKGHSIVPATRTDRMPFQVTFDLRSEQGSELIVGSRTVWQGGGVC